MFKRYGLPTRVVSDRGPQFTAKLTKKLWKGLGITLALSMVYHPQTDGETERVNQEIKQFLQIFCNYHQDNWVDLLPFAEFSHNTQKHSTIGKSPFKVLYGFNLPYLVDSALETKVPVVTECLQLIKEAQEEAAASLQIAVQHAKDQDLHRKLPQWEAGTQVWLEGTHIRTTHPKLKLGPRHYGPFQVKERISPLAYWLEIPETWKIHPVFHTSILIQYHETEAYRRNYPRPAPEILNKEEHHKVEAVLDSRRQGRGTKYLIKWVGYSEADNT